MPRTTTAATELAVLTITLTACAQGGAVSAGCRAVLGFHGATYLEAPLVADPPSHCPPLRTIGEAVIPPCNDVDTVADSARTRETARAAEVARLPRVDPAVAVAVLPAGTVYVRQHATLPEWVYSAPWIRRS